ncbi:MAG: PAS domain-containing protein, partial [Planctomycetota bacterium]
SAVTGPTVAIVSCRSLEAPEVELWLRTLVESSALVWILVTEEAGLQSELPETLLSAAPRELRILRDGSTARSGDLWILPVGERAAWNGKRFRWQLPLRGPETPSPFESLVESFTVNEETAPQVIPIRLEQEHAKIGADGETRTVFLSDLTQELERGLSSQSASTSAPTLDSSDTGPWAIVAGDGRVLSASPEAGWLTTLDGAHERLHADLDAPLCSAIRTLQAGGMTVHVPERPVQAGGKSRPIGFVLAESKEVSGAEPRFRVSFHSSLPWQAGSAPPANLRSSELESFYNSAPIGLAAIDSEYRYIRINDRLAAMNGLPAHDHIGKTIHEVLGASGRSIEETMRPVLEDGVAIRDLETRGKTRVDEDMRDWLVQYTPIHDERGKVAGVNVVVQDVTPQKEASRRLAAEHAITHLLADEVSSADLFPEILETLCQTLEIEIGEVWLYNESSETIEPTHSFSISQDQASRAFQEAIPELPADRTGCPGQRAWLSQKTEVFRSLDLDTDFPRRELASACGIQLAMAFPMMGEGLPYGAIALYGERAFIDEAALHDSLETIGRDIGRFVRRERIELALRQSEKELRILTDSIPMKISFVDAEGRYRFTNQEYVRSFGLSKEELYGRHVRDVVGESAYEQVEPMMERALSGALVEYEVDLEEESGLPATLAVKYKPREEPDGSISGFYALVVDVTQRANAERESVHKANCLEEIRRVNLELTGELDLARLERSVTEAAVKISGAEAGAFVHRIADESRKRAAVYSTVAEPPSRELKSSQAEYALQGPTLGATTSVRIGDLRDKPEFAGSLRL